MIFVMFLFVALSAFLGVVAINYFDAKKECDTHIRFDTFTKLYSRFPSKWFLNGSYVELETYGMDNNGKAFIGHALRLYFKNPIDLIRYYFFKDKIEKQKRLEREQMNQDYFVQAFRKLEEWEKQDERVRKEL